MPAAIRIDLCSTAEVAPGNALQVDKAGPVLAVFMPVPGQQPNTHDWGARYPLIVQAVNKLKARSCVIDGEAVCCNEHGVPIFEKLRHRSNDQSVILIAFDLLELDGTDLRHEPFETRKATLASLLRRAGPGVQLNEHLAHEDGEVVFRHACKMGLEGIVSKRLGSRYRSGRSPDWLKMKNPDAPAVKREAEEDWGR